MLLVIKLIIELIFCFTFSDAFAASSTSNSLGECNDMHGDAVEQGRFYIPGPEVCRMCVCDGGKPRSCKAVLCSPPHECKAFQIGTNCCDFICLDNAPVKPVPEKASDFVL